MSSSAPDSPGRSTGEPETADLGRKGASIPARRPDPLAAAPRPAPPGPPGPANQRRHKEETCRTA
ncbi:hypothetical protein FRY98_24225 [Paenibacillus faecis]|uniref:Uncharacterized protein n=1 Tax=Paenibacillus faecis TaxID=862114 RepID=A0A5D0CMI3_9BACL|nr:hypothetical protein FRY98_24225 [Paenibacillus faecis]